MGPADQQRPQHGQLRRRPQDRRRLHRHVVPGQRRRVTSTRSTTTSSTTSTAPSYTNIDEGLRADARHPLLPETYRWHFEKRSHQEQDDWSHLFDFAVAMNTSASNPVYEQTIEAKIDPRHFTRMLAVRHAVGNWDSYGYTRGKNNSFYYALPEGKWYLLPWDIDFTLGSGRGASSEPVRSGRPVPGGHGLPELSEVQADVLRRLPGAGGRALEDLLRHERSADGLRPLPRRGGRRAGRRRLGRRPAQRDQAVRPRPPQLHPVPVPARARHSAAASDEHRA